MLEPVVDLGKGPFTMLHHLSVQDWIDHLKVWQTDPWRAWDTHQGGYVLALIMALILPVARMLLRTLISQPLGNKVLPKEFRKKDRNEVDPGLMKKFNALLMSGIYQTFCIEAAWRAAFYASVLVVGGFVIRHQKFVTDTTYFWRGCNQFPPCNYSVPLLMRLLYSMELGFYVQAIPYLMFWEVKRKDFREQFGHHLATIGLIVYSYEVNFMKIGTMVFLCHDINDVFMETAKLVKYAKQEAAANVLFGLFVVSWFVSRMFYFPVWIIQSAWSEPNSVIADVYGISPHPHQEIFLALLCFLFALHTYWSYLILRIVVRQLASGVAEDIREEEESPVRQFEKETPGTRSP